ncbi:hypothetical protein [Bacillus sp. 3255]|uniref:hypothetical protein n=1 Tax=Bacillus sp. 3255 TaxID=2817904 RepID=UPI00285B70EB|nr:hypothetical protein [Bacillus sp. 3255]MDR6883563.1 hypothetical protein [Bacillus sp. 3255]
MKVDYGIMDSKFEHCAHVLGLIEQLIAFKQPGDYRLNERFTLEVAQFNQIATAFRESKVPELAAYGWRCQTLIREFEEYDRVCREHAQNDRLKQRQHRLLNESLRKYDLAGQALRRPMAKGLI